MMIFIKTLLIFSWAIFIFILVDQPFPETKINSIPFFDKGVHFFIFGVLALLIISALKEHRRFGFNKIYLITFFLSVIYSAFTEYFQNFVPGRSSSYLDFFAGVIGVMSIITHYYCKNKKPKLLLHVCCIGCGAYISKILKSDYNIALYFYNPNIFPKPEYDKRLDEAKIIAKKFGIDLIIGDYGHQQWLEAVRGLENEPEKGKRCEVCYKFRMEETAKHAKGKGYNFFSTTLTISPHKDAKAISRIGTELALKYNAFFLDKDFKKQDGFKKSCELSTKLGLYRQNYCGCEFSIKEK